MQQKEKYQEAFGKTMATLNAKQREAVERIDGPVLVIAGPGTGKTQILAARIGHILNTTDARPDNILCLTYTDAGTIAMRKRLLQFIGPDAYKVDIFTFHSFCNRVIKDNMEKFGMRALDSITELEQVELMHQLIDTFGSDHILKRWTGEVYYDSYRLKKLFSIMKSENWTPELICQKADEYIESLPEREEYQYKRGNKTKGIEKGDPKQSAIDAEVRKMEELKAAANEFPKYKEMMAARKRYDYDDMILLVLEHFRKDEELLRRYQEQYQYFLVDEYQDTNGAQNQILNLLAGYWDNPNLFVVGDDDQSIFRFQGANVANILDLNQRYNPHVIVMTDNYRSSQHILDLSRTLIESNNERLVNQIPDLTKVLQANHDAYAQTHVKPEVREYYNEAHETVGIAHEIEQLKKDGVDLAEVAVIYRNHKQSEDIARYLESKGIAVNIKRKANILDSPFIRKIRNILTYIESESALPFSREDLLFEILHFDFYNNNAIVLGKLALQLRNKRGEKGTTWRETIQNVAEGVKMNMFPSVEDQTYVRLKEISRNIEEWISGVHNTTLQVLFEVIMTRGGILRYVMDHPEKFKLMQELSTFFEFIKAESVKDPKVTLKAFLKTIDLMEQNSIRQDIQRTTYSENGVNFVTAHGSKGLEYQYVYMIGSTSDAWDKKGRSGTFKFPDNLVTQIGDGDESEEQRRLFYVALTRAKQHLYISYPAQNNDEKELQHSRFVHELTESEGMEIQHIHLPSEDLLSYNMMVMREQALPDLQLLEEQYLRKILENYSLSVSHLNTYLKCPVSFYYSYMLRIPMAKNQYMAFGSAVHFAMERMFLSMMGDKANNAFPPSKQLVKDFEWYMFRHMDSFTEEEFGRRLDYGREILPKYYDQYVAGWNKVVSVERNLRAVVSGVPINGKLDKIEFDGNNANVVDYKTGKWNTNKRKYFKTPTDDFKGKEPKHEDLFGGDYWRQAVFYKILVDNDPSNTWNVVSTEFDFVEPDQKSGEFHKEKVIITDADLDTVRAQIADTYSKIQMLQFKDGCNEPDCQWCNFVRNNFELNTAELVTDPQELEG